MDKKETFSLDKNLHNLRKIFDDKFIEKSEKLNLTKEDIEKANETLACAVYGDEISQMVLKNQMKDVLGIYAQSVQKNFKKLENIDLDFNKIGLLLVRPEVYNLTSKFKEFILNKGFQIVFENDIVPTFDQYLVLYPHGICIKEAKYDFPTRTFNYVKNKCKLFVIYGDSTKYSFSNMSDYLNSIKGKPGRYQEGTLRSDIAYKELLQYIMDRNNYKAGYNSLFDPIGAYRFLVKGELPNDNNLSNIINPLLFYSGQAVHIPNQNEIARDFCTLLNANEILKITKTIGEKQQSNIENIIIKLN